MKRKETLSKVSLRLPFAAPQGKPTAFPSRRSERKCVSRLAGAAVGPLPPQFRCLERQGRGSRFFPRCLGAHAHPKWTVSRVLFRPPVTRRVGEDHSSRRRIAAPLERSDPDAGRCTLRCSGFGRVALDSIPIRACSGRGLPRRRSPGCRAWALTPRFQPCLCLHARASRRAASPAIGGLVSVALSLGSPRVVVNDLPTLWSPDFPPADGGCPPAILHPPPAAIGYRAAHGQGKRMAVSCRGKRQAAQAEDRCWGEHTGAQGLGERTAAQGLASARLRGDLAPGSGVLGFA